MDPGAEPPNPPSPAAFLMEGAGGSASTSSVSPGVLAAVRTCVH